MIPTINSTCHLNLRRGIIRACPIWQFFGLAVKSWADLGFGIVGFVYIECHFESVVVDFVTVGSDFFRPHGEVAIKSGLRIIS